MQYTSIERKLHLKKLFLRETRIGLYSETRLWEWRFPFQLGVVLVYEVFNECEKVRIGGEDVESAGSKTLPELSFLLGQNLLSPLWYILSLYPDFCPRRNCANDPVLNFDVDCGKYEYNVQK